jgi:hypothetical protein
MNELLWKLNVPKLPLAEQEYYEIALEDPPNVWGDAYIVRQTHFQWDEEQTRMVPTDRLIDRAETRGEAEARYVLHRRILVDQGFACSDMDPIL